MPLNKHKKFETYVVIANLKSETMGKLINRISGSCLLISSYQALLWERMLNRSANLAMITSVPKALPGKLDIKNHSPCILYITLFNHVFARCNKKSTSSLLEKTFHKDWKHFASDMFYCVFVTFPCDYLGHVCYLIVSISCSKVIKNHAQLNCAWNFNCSWKPKYRQITKFLDLSLSDVVFIMLINVKMPTIVGTLTIKQDKVRAQLSWVWKKCITSWPDLYPLTFFKRLKVKRVWSGNTTITHRRLAQGTVRKSHRIFTVTRHPTDNKSKSTSSSSSSR